MGMNRRKVLMSLGVIVITGGLLFGTGAFTTVEADRTVNVDSAGDGSAQLQMELSGGLDGSNGDTIAFDLAGNGVNLNATTTFGGALTITNNGANTVDIDIEDESGASMIGPGASTTSNMTFEPQGSATGVSNTGSVTFDVIFDLTGVTTQGSEDIPDTITINATKSP